MVLALVIAYVGLIFVLAIWAERQERRGRRVGSNAFVYSLSLAAYCTTWTFYGSVGSAASNGLLFLAVYLGPTIALMAWWWMLRKLVRIKNVHRVTSLADLLSVRYGKSQSVAMVATAGLLIGLVPYLALQIKAMTTGVTLLTGSDPSRARSMGTYLGLPIVLLLIAFTIVLGIRRLSPTERHPGMIVAVAAECVLKLAAFIAAGAFVTYGLFDGFADVFHRAGEAATVAVPDLLGPRASMATWVTTLLLSASAILFLPRQFHVAVVENADEKHIRTAMWLFPLYMLAMTVFVLPVALGGLLLGHPAALADTFLLRLPYEAGARSLAWFVFLGGFSAGIGMVVLETMTLATMISNHLVLPAVNLWPSLGRLRRHLLPVRWAAAAVVILAAFAYERAFGEQDTLVSIGLISFAAVLQLAPAVLAGLYWRGASTTGALAGLAAGFGAWAYTLVLPVFIRAGWLPQRLLAEGPAGLSALRPEALFWVGGFDSLSHAVFWSMLFNVGALVLGSVLFPASAAEESRAECIVEALEPPRGAQPLLADGSHLTEVSGKRERIVSLYAQYFKTSEAERLANTCLEKVGVAPDGHLSALQLASLEEEVETTLASCVGTAAAHTALKTGGLATVAEARAISSAYRGLAQTVALLARSESRTRAVIESALDGIFLLDVEGSVQSVNTAGARMFGWAPDLVVGRDFLTEFVAPRSRLCWRPTSSPAADAAVSSSGRGEAHGLHRDGHEFPIECRFTEFQTDAGTGICAFVRDLSASKRLEMELQQARKLEAVGSLAAGIAHEINTPMQFIGDNTRFLQEAFTELFEVLAKHLPGPGSAACDARSQDEEADLEYLREEAPKAIERTLQGVERVATIVRAMKEFAHPDQREMVGADLNRSVQATLEIARNEYKYVASVETDLGELPPVTCYPSELNQVFLNILVNAAHAIADVVKDTPEKGKIRVSTRRDGPDAVVTVSDTGGGIPDAIRHRVFDPFFTTKEVGRGTGQGLAIARTIVQKHHGSVTFDTEPGKGTTFVIRVPIDAKSGAPQGGAACSSTAS